MTAPERGGWLLIAIGVVLLFIGVRHSTHSILCGGRKMSLEITQVFDLPVSHSRTQATLHGRTS